MKAFFSTVKWISFVASFLLIIPAALIYLSTPLALMKNKKFKEEEFFPAIAYVESFKSLSSRLPTVDEFESWKLSVGKENQQVFYHVEGSLRSEGCSFDGVTKGNYGITIFRGEWYECFSSSVAGYSFDDAAEVNSAAYTKLFSIALILFSLAVFLHFNGSSNIKKHQLGGEAYC